MANAFRQGIQATIPALRRYARALTRDAETADDLVQDTLVRALRSEHLFHGGDIRSWLYTILTNLNRNRLRSLSRRPTHTPIEDTDAPDASGPETGGRDIELTLAPIAGTRLLAPFRLSIANMLGNMVIEATEFETTTTSAARAALPAATTAQ